MQSLSRILLPVDFSERSVGAAHYAGTLACHFGCELVLMHVLIPPQYEFGAVDIAGSMLAELCRDRLDGVVEIEVRVSILEERFETLREVEDDDIEPIPHEI